MAEAVQNANEQIRTEACRILSETPQMDVEDPKFFHGRLYEGPADPPKCIWKSKNKPRDDHEAPDWLTASEFEDHPTVMEAKCKKLAALIRASKKTVVYTGAGISASVVGQAARSGQNKVGWKGNRHTCKPTYTHFALAYLGQQDLIQGWVQQNHDGLPQKAGCPQHKINEIHGSWYDPSNPVVKYSGTLHDRAYPWMENDAETADLVLVLGTSLGGLNADQVCHDAANRSNVGAALGSVIFNLQQTDQDGNMTLRMNGKSDDYLKCLLKHLGVPKLSTVSPVFAKGNKALVPYDKDGNKCEDRRMWLDLSPYKKIRITPGHNIQGAKQPQYMHIGAKKATVHKGVKRKPGVGIGTVRARSDEKQCFDLVIEGVNMRLGMWWLDEAEKGLLEKLPIVNVNPKYE